MPQRIQRRRTRGWRMPEGAIYVGRPTMWGNPFYVGCHAQIGGPVGGKGPLSGMTWSYCIAAEPDYGFETLTTPEECVKWFRRLYERGFQKKELAKLRGKDLACWCPLDAPCHADVLLGLANAPKPHS